MKKSNKEEKGEKRRREGGEKVGGQVRKGKK